MCADDELLEQDITQRTCKIQQAVYSDRQHCKQGFADPAGCYRLEREDEEVKKVCPQYCAIYGAGHLQKVVVIGPVRADHYKTDQIAGHQGENGDERAHVIPFWETDLENRNCDDDGNHAIAE